MTLPVTEIKDTYATVGMTKRGIWRKW